VLNGESPVEKVAVPKSWPVTIVAAFFLAQGLWAGYIALAYVGLFGYPTRSGTMVGFATVDAIESVALIVAGAGLFARNRACLTIAVVLAALFLMSAGNYLAEASFAATPMGALAAIVFVAVGWLQYAILRSRSTTALFPKSL
jgi:hypothetical protein